MKPNIGVRARSSSGSTRAPISRPALATLDFGSDGTALVQEFVESEGGAIVRARSWTISYLYAIRIVRPASSFNLCPADICQIPAPSPSADLGVCPVEAKPGLSGDPLRRARAVVEQARALARAASIDVGESSTSWAAPTAPRLSLRRQRHVQLRRRRAGGCSGSTCSRSFADYIVRVATARA